MTRRVMVWVFLSGLVVRVAYLAAFHGTPFSEILLVDARWHDEWAWNWVGSGLDMGDTAFFRAPFYAYWLSWVYRIFGHDLSAVRVIQSLMGAGAAAAIGGALARLWAPRYGMIAGLMAAFYGPFIYFDQELLIPSLLVFLLAWVLFVAVLRPTPRRSAAVGILLGFAVITRPNALILVPVILWFSWVRTVGRPTFSRTLMAALFLVAALLPASYVTYLNYRAEGVPVFVAGQGGINFYGGNNPQASGKSVDIPEFSNMVNWREFVPRMQVLAENQAGRSLNSLEVSNYWTERGIQWIKENPGDALVLYLKKATYLFSGHEIPNNRSLYFRTHWPLKGFLWDTPILSFPAGAVIPLALVGFILVLGNPRYRRGGMFLLGWVLFYGASLLPFFVCGRFRLPILPALLGPAAFALYHWREILRPRILAVFIVTGLLVNAGFFDARQESPEGDLTQLGAALFEQGDLPGATAALNEALEIAPENLGASFWLAFVYSRAGEIEKAIPLYKMLVAARPADAALWFQLGTSRFELGDFPGSVKPLKEAAGLDRENFKYHVNLGAAYEENEMEVEAIDSYRRGIQLEPRHPLAYLRLAGILTQRGDDRESADVLRHGVSVLPRNFEIRYRLAVAYRRLGMDNRALEEATAALGLKPDSREATELLRFLSHDKPQE